MLTIKRRVGESILINDQIEIKILSDKDGVRVGIEAPKHMSIMKAERKAYYQARNNQPRPPFVNSRTWE